MTWTKCHKSQTPHLPHTQTPTHPHVIANMDKLFYNLQESSKHGPVGVGKPEQVPPHPSPLAQGATYIDTLYEINVNYRGLRSKQSLSTLITVASISDHRWFGLEWAETWPSVLKQIMSYYFQKSS